MGSRAIMSQKIARSDGAAVGEEHPNPTTSVHSIEHTLRSQPAKFRSTEAKILAQNLVGVLP